MAEPNWVNQTIFTGDCLDVMRRMNSECVDLIYLDPPFNSNANYAAPIGSQAAGAEFKDTWGLDEIKNAWHALIQDEYPELYNYLKAIRNIHSDSMMAYLIYMTPRIMEMKRLLKTTGSIYLHCDHHASHYLKILMDQTFGRKQFRNEIVWERDPPGKGGKRLSKQWPRNHEVLFYYTKTEKYIFKQQYTQLSDKQKNAYRYKEISGRRYKAVQRGSYSDKSMRNFRELNKIHTSKTGKEYIKYYLDEAKATIGGVWTDIYGFGTRTASKEITHHPTQKPLKLVNRIIQASSDRGGGRS